MKRSRNYLSIAEKVQQGKEYPLVDAIKLLKENGKFKLDPTLEVHMNLGVDPRHSDQVVRGNVVLPHGTGRTVRVLVFAKGELEKAATGAGADHVGAEELVQKISDGWLDFDASINRIWRRGGATSPIHFPRFSSFSEFRNGARDALSR